MYIYLHPYTVHVHVKAYMCLFVYVVGMQASRRASTYA